MLSPDKGSPDTVSMVRTGSSDMGIMGRRSPNFADSSAVTSLSVAPWASRDVR